MEKNMIKNVYICITESLCCTAEINTTLEINYTSIKYIKRNFSWLIPCCFQNFLISGSDICLLLNPLRTDIFNTALRLYWVPALEWGTGWCGSQLKSWWSASYRISGTLTFGKQKSQDILTSAHCASILRSLLFIFWIALMSPPSLWTWQMRFTVYWPSYK